MLFLNCDLKMIIKKSPDRGKKSASAADSTAIHLMTEGSPVKNIVLFAFPLLWGNLFQQLYNIADTLIVGNFLGNTALAAVSSSGNLVFLMVSLLNGIGMGCGVVIARFFGAEDTRKLRRAMHTALAFGLICGLALSAIAPVAAPVILRLIGTPAEVLPLSVTYFRLYFMGAAGSVLFNMQMGILQSLGDSRHPVLFLAFSASLNIFLDLLFIGCFGFGVGGAAVATAMTQFLSAALCFRQLLKNPEEYRVVPKEIRIYRDMLKQILVNGIPAGIQNSIISIANVFVQSNINRFGPMAMAGCGSYSRVEGFVFIPVMCFTQALVTFVGQNLGAGKKERAYRGGLAGTGLAMMTAGGIGVLVIVFSPYLLGAFGGDPEAVAIGIREAHIAPAFFSLLAFSHCMAAIQRGAGHSMVPMFIMMVVWCFIRVSYIAAAVHFIPRIEVVFWAYPLTWGISSVIFLIIFLRKKWLD